MIQAEQLLERAQESLSGRRVFGDPVERAGVTVIPAADVVGGGGGGSGRSDDGEEGFGGGVGLRARPAGVYVIDEHGVHWKPSVDVNRLSALLAGVTVALLCYRWRVAAIRARPTGTRQES